MSKEHLNDVSTCPFLRAIKAEKPHLGSPMIKKVFINCVFCSNWAVRNPAGSRLDSLAG